MRGEVGQVLLSPCGGSCVEFFQLVVLFSQLSAFVFVVRRFSGTVGKEGADLPPRRFLAGTAELGQHRDFVVGSESAFSVDKLNHKDTVLVGNVSRRDFLCYSQAGPASVTHVLVLFLCLRVGSLSPLFICLSDCTPSVSLCPCIRSLSVVAGPYFLVPRYRGFSVWCCPLLSRLAGSGPEGSDGSALKEGGSVVWVGCLCVVMSG